MPELDWVGLDIKALQQDYPTLTGVPGSGEKAFISLRLLLQSGVAHEVRITLHEASLPPAIRDLLVALLHEYGAREIRLQGCRDLRCIDHLVNRLQRMVFRHPRIWADRVEQDVFLTIRSTHGACFHPRQRTAIVSTSRPISTAC